VPAAAPAANSASTSPRRTESPSAPLLLGTPPSDRFVPLPIKRPPDMSSDELESALPMTACVRTLDAEKPQSARSEGSDADELRERLRQSELRSACVVLAIGAVFFLGFLFGYGARDIEDEDEARDENLLIEWVLSQLRYAEHWMTAPLGPEVCENGLFLQGPRRTALNAVLELLFMLWCFVGIAIGSDVFMAAIEAITRAEKEKWVMMGGRKEARTIPVWNSTVANLTLMALGSSAPEICLSVIEVGSSGFYAGELGPSTIVGSAAFNLLIILAVCVTALPKGEGRLIQAQVVFYVTATFSVLSYLWLLIILQMNTPNVVDIWEAAVTLFAFPALVYIAYKTEVTGTILWCKAKKKRVTRVVNVSAPVSTGLSLREGSKKNHAYYRSNVVRTATGKAAKGVPDMTPRSISLITINDGTNWTESDTLVIEFERQICFFEPSDEVAQVKVLRHGKLHEACRVAYTCSEQTGKIGNNGQANSVTFAEGFLTFDKFQSALSIEVELTEDDHDFSVYTGSRFHVGLLETAGVTLGDNRVCGVVKGWDKNFSGVFSPTCGNKVKTRESEGKLELVLARQGGIDQRVTVRARTKSLTAVGDKDFESVDTELVFEPGVSEVSLTIVIYDDDMYEEEEYFQVIFSDLSEGVFSSLCDGGPYCSIVTVAIESDTTTKEQASVVELLAVKFKCNLHLLEKARDDWMEQWREALSYEPGNGLIGGISFLVAVPWRILFALSPPPLLLGGWGCFLISLLLIGLVTAVVGDLAANLGCVLGVTKSITAITLVAMGTSLPDTFASRTAARDEETADASIGNVTGSNSVNVLLGLGLPWLSAAVYWNFVPKGGAKEAEWRARYSSEPWYTPDMPVAFAVPAGDLAYSVGIFTTCAIACLATIILRRETVGYELGGPSPMWDKLTALFFIALWIFYIYMSVLNSLETAS